MATKKASRNPMEPLFSPKPSKGAMKGESGSKKNQYTAKPISKRAKAIQREKDEREMETRKPGKRYPAFNVQPQRPQRPGNKPVEMPKKRKKAAAPKRAAVKRSYR